MLLQEVSKPMYYVPSHKPAREIFGTSVTVLNNGNEVNKRLNMLGIRNSIIGTLPTIYENEEYKEKDELNDFDTTRFTFPAECSYDFAFRERDLARRLTSTPKNRSIWVWLWHEWLSYHGNCALCDRPLNGTTEPVVMNACTHALHMECAEEARISSRECPKCVTIKTKRLSRKCTARCCCTS